MVNNCPSNTVPFGQLYQKPIEQKLLIKKEEPKIDRFDKKADSQPCLSLALSK